MTIIQAAFFGSWFIGWRGGPSGDFLMATATLSGIAHFATLFYLPGSTSRRVFAHDQREAVEATPRLQGRGHWPLGLDIIPSSTCAEWGLILSSNGFASLAGPSLD